MDADDGMPCLISRDKVHVMMDGLCKGPESPKTDARCQDGVRSIPSRTRRNERHNIGAYGCRSFDSDSREVRMEVYCGWE